MGGDETINVVILLLIVFAMVGMLRGRGTSLRNRDLQRQVAELQMAQAGQTAVPAALPGASQEQIQRLEERVRVLERIVTDKGLTLAAEIEALRDERRELERND